jgi:anthranilate phosphoribosyltransferase
MDEISIGAATRVAELKGGEVQNFTIRPEDFGLAAGDVSALSVDSAEASLALIRGVFADEPGAARDIVAVNAGAAIYAAGVAEDLNGGVQKAMHALSIGAAQRKLEEFVEFTNR